MSLLNEKSRFGIGEWQLIQSNVPNSVVARTLGISPTYIHKIRTEKKTGVNWKNNTSGKYAELIAKYQQVNGGSPTTKAATESVMTSAPAKPAAEPATTSVATKLAATSTLVNHSNVNAEMTQREKEAYSAKAKYEIGEAIKRQFKETNVQVTIGGEAFMFNKNFSVANILRQTKKTMDYVAKEFADRLKMHFKPKVPRNLGSVASWRPIINAKGNDLDIAIAVETYYIDADGRSWKYPFNLYFDKVKPKVEKPTGWAQVRWIK